MWVSVSAYLENTSSTVLTIAILSVIIGLINNASLQVGNLFSLIRSCIVTGIFALGVHMVIVSGDIDVSFMAIATFSMYVTGRFLINNPQYADNLFLAFAMSAVIGMCLGALNAWFISTFKLPTFVVTLGTQNVYRGFLLAFIGTRLITTLPKCMLDLSRSNLVSVLQGRILCLPNTIWFLVVLTIITWLIMRYTKLGRGIYAIGGDRWLRSGLASTLPASACSCTPTWAFWRGSRASSMLP